jgi:hypothetical protein
MDDILDPAREPPVALTLPGGKRLGDHRLPGLDGGINKCQSACSYCCDVDLDGDHVSGGRSNQSAAREGPQFGTVWLETPNGTHPRLQSCAIDYVQAVRCRQNSGSSALGVITTHDEPEP